MEIQCLNEIGQTSVFKQDRTREIQCLNEIGHGKFSLTSTIFFILNLVWDFLLIKRWAVIFI